MQNQPGRKFSVQTSEELQRLLMAVSLHAVGDDSAFQKVQRGKHGGCSVALMIMRQSFTAALHQPPRCQVAKHESFETHRHRLCSDFCRLISYATARGIEDPGSLHLLRSSGAYPHHPKSFRKVTWTIALSASHKVLESVQDFQKGHRPSAFQSCTVYLLCILG